MAGARGRLQGSNALKPSAVAARIPPASTIRVISASFALSAFAVALVSGLGTGNSAAQILLRAVLAMLVCYLAGAVIGAACDRVIAAAVVASEERAKSAATSSDLQPESKSDVSAQEAASVARPRAAA
jgi:hypothetical protein